MSYSPTPPFIETVSANGSAGLGSVPSVKPDNPWEFHERDLKEYQDSFSRILKERLYRINPCHLGSGGISVEWFRCTWDVSCDVSRRISPATEGHTEIVVRSPSEFSSLMKQENVPESWEKLLNLNCKIIMPMLSNVEVKIFWQLMRELLAGPYTVGIIVNKVPV